LAASAYETPEGIMESLRNELNDIPPESFTKEILKRLQK
jgi:hypothetical protein